MIQLTTRLASVFMILAAFTAHADVIVDDDMNGSTYTSFSFNGNDSGSNPADISSESFTFFSTGGNPDHRMEVSHTHEVDVPSANGLFDTFVQSIFSNQDVFYNPASQGVVSQIDLSIDIRTTDAFSSLFFAVFDDNGGSIAGFTSIDTFADGNWHTIEVNGLTQSNFSSRDFSGALDLGFAFGLISAADVIDGPITRTADIDNFKVTINSIPEPASGFLLVGAAIGFMYRRRR